MHTDQPNMPNPAGKNAEATILQLCMTAMLLDIVRSSFDIPRQKVEHYAHAAAQVHGIHPDLIEDCVGRVTHRFFEEFKFTQGKTIADMKPMVWVESWKDETRTLEQRTIERIPHKGERDGADLIVDEVRRVCHGPTGSILLDKLGIRENRVLYLMLTRCGSGFDHINILDIAGSASEGECRKHKLSGNELTDILIGRQLLPKPVRKWTAVPGDGWSWIWMREHEDHEESLLFKKAKPPTL